MSKAVAVVVMGVSGCGKSGLGAALANAQGWPFLEGDSLHSPANIARMQAGQPLTDADRAPWLAAIETWMSDRLRGGYSVVVACSALRRSYREGGSVRNETLGNLSHLPDDLIEIIRRSLQAETLVALTQAFEITAS